MVLDLFLNAIFSVIDLLRGTLFLSIIAFVGVFFASFLHAWLSKKYNLSWLKATIITSYLAIFILIMVLYFAPVISGFSDSDQGSIPEFFQSTPADTIVFFVTILLRNAAIALLYAFFVLPLEFLASMVFDFLKEKKTNKWLGVFAAVFVACLATTIVLLFLLPWVLPGLLYLTFYWHL